MVKKFIKFILYFLIIAVGGVIYSIVKELIPINVLSAKDKTLIGILCMSFYYVGMLIMFLYKKFSLM